MNVLQVYPEGRCVRGWTNIRIKPRNKAKNLQLKLEAIH